MLKVFSSLGWVGLFLLAACSRHGFDPGNQPFDVPFLPANLEGKLDLHAGIADLTVGDDPLRYWVISTDDGSITAYDGPAPAEAESRQIRPPEPGDVGGVVFRTVTSPAEPGSLAVFALGNLEIREGAVLLGIGTRPLVLLVAEEARIQGTLSVAADRLVGQRHPGAGGFRGGPTAQVPGEGPGAGQAPTQIRSGAGGAGHGLTGGPGGAGEAEEDRGAAGEVCGDSTLVPLVGGSGGGASFGLGGNGGGGGGGGGGAGGRIRINTFTGTVSYPLGLLPTQASGLTTVGSLDM